MLHRNHRRTERAGTGRQDALTPTFLPYRRGSRPMLVVLVTIVHVVYSNSYVRTLAHAPPEDM